MKDRNVLFLTLDSCRYDTFLSARTPNFDAIGKVRLAGTHGTYTLPAHMSFFMGYLPSVIEPPHHEYYTSEIKQLWRLSAGRPRDPSTIGINITSSSVPNFYQDQNFQVIGSGGVRWFRHPLLAGQFRDFRFYGKSDLISVFAERANSEFPLSHIDELMACLDGRKLFLFINCPETHVPYNHGSKPLSEKAKSIINKYQHIWGCKAATTVNYSIDIGELRSLHEIQIEALEEVDRKFGILLRLMPRPLLIVVAGDHGECFGEDEKWGHGFPHQKVMEVPLIISTVD